MNLINIFRKNVLYFFLSLPFVIVLYQFLMIVTLGASNRGYVVLFLSQVTVVPILISLLNLMFMDAMLINIVVTLLVLGIIGFLIYAIYFFVVNQSK